MIANWKNKSLKNIVQKIGNIVYTERWKDVIGYEGIYRVSDFGRVKSLDRCYKTGRGMVARYVKGRIISQACTLRGYPFVLLHKNGTIVNKLVHLLVAALFLKRPKKVVEINHVKGKKTDNRVLKLEWITHADNIIHAYKKGLIIHNKGRDHQSSRSVSMYSKSGKKIKEFFSITEANIKTKINIGNIGSVCSGNRTTAGGYIWKYN